MTSSTTLGLSDAIELTEDDQALLEAVREMSPGIERRKIIKEMAHRHRVKQSDVEAELRDAGESTTVAAPAEDVTELYDRGRSILEASDFTGEVRAQLRADGFAGDTRTAELIALAIHSRNMDRPLNLAILGPSSAGKTYLVGAALRFHPDDAVVDLTAMSERALVYWDEPIAHRYIWISEASALFQDGVGATILREIAWGNGIRYMTVVKGPKGLEPREIRKAGPTGFITTTTRPELDPELATRLLAVTVDDSPAQTRAIIVARAAAAASPSGPSAGDRHERFAAASHWLEIEGVSKIVVPFASSLAELLPDTEVRLRRDVDQVLCLIKTAAFVHQRSRRVVDGSIIAERADYELAFRLLAPVLAATVTRTSPAVRELVAAVKKLVESGEHHDGVNYAPLERELGIGRAAVSGRVRQARAAGFVVNRETRRGLPAQLVPGDPLPDEADTVLPTPDDVFRVTEPQNSAEHPNTSPEIVGTQGDRGVRVGVRSSGEHPGQLNTQVNTPKPLPDNGLKVGVQVFGRNPGSIEGEI